MVELVGRHGDIFRETTIGAVTVVVRGQVDIPTVVGVEVEVQQAPLADPRFVHTLPHSDNTPNNVRALNSGEGQRG